MPQGMARFFCPDISGYPHKPGHRSSLPADGLHLKQWTTTYTKISVITPVCLLKMDRQTTPSTLIVTNMAHS